MGPHKGQGQRQQLPWTWGAPVWVDASAAPVDLRSSDVRLATRAVRTSADPAALFLWLCQLRRAPYSYDWIDNFGRRSPRESDPALRDLEVGATFMTIFTLAAYEAGRSLTLRMKPGWPTRAFGALAVRYQVEQLDRSGSQLGVAMWLPPAGRHGWRLRQWLLAWGDLLMMRRQLRVLSRLAERDASVLLPDERETGN